MNALPLIRSRIEKADRIHKAQLIATSHGSKFHDQLVPNLKSALRKEKAKLLHNAQLMSF